MARITKFAVLALSAGVVFAAVAPPASADDGEACVTVLSTEIACVCVELGRCSAALPR